jgi:calcineurin-like phosphoesterase family protein
MGKEKRCDPAGRVKQRRGWSVLLAVATAVGAALLTFGLYDGSSARAQTAGKAVLVGAGDIASCESRGDRATAKLLGSISGTVLAAGDNVYENSTLSDFRTCYGRTWGHYKNRTKPVVGNHEYDNPRASGYFNYFGAAAGQRGKGYYSYDRGAWHIVALNSECEHLKGGCAANSPMLRWLEDDLKANPARCTLAYFHRPRFSSGQNGNNAKMRPIWNALYKANADVVVGGHDHVYERFARQTPKGVRSARGIREFVVGTGGAHHGKFKTVEANSQVRNAHTYGVLKLTLHPASYSWRFVPVAGKTFTDSGTTKCNSG